MLPNDGRDGQTASLPSISLRASWRIFSGATDGDISRRCSIGGSTADLNLLIIVFGRHRSFFSSRQANNCRSVRCRRVIVVDDPAVKIAGAKGRVRFVNVGKLNCSMITWLFDRCRACIVLVALVALMDLPARGAAYLPIVGPPPLRFAPAKAGAKNVAWTPPTPTLPTSVVETNKSNATPAIPANNIAPPPPAVEPASIPVPLPVENLSTNSTVQTHPANNLLVVTPEMLVDYFKPNNKATNAANVRVLVPVNFTPPASASTPSSQAIYLSP